MVATLQMPPAQRRALMEAMGEAPAAALLAGRAVSWPGLGWFQDPQAGVHPVQLPDQ
ncbi:MAG: hypothetical protein R3F59_15935 [Myxococcota bacterium]